MYTQIIRYQHLLNLAPDQRSDYAILGDDYLKEKNHFILLSHHPLAVSKDLYFNYDYLNTNPDFHKDINLATGLYIDNLENHLDSSIAQAFYAAGLREGDTIIDIQGVSLTELHKTHNEIEATQHFLQVLDQHKELKISYIRLCHKKNTVLYCPKSLSELSIENSYSDFFSLTWVLPYQQQRAGILIKTLRNTVYQGQDYINPLRRAGLRSGDILVRLGGIGVNDDKFSTFNEQLELEELDITYVRHGQEHQCHAVISQITDDNGNVFRVGMFSTKKPAYSLSKGLEVAGLFAMKGLSVTGSIINDTGGPFLLIRNSLHAKHLILSDATVEIYGDAHIQEVSYLYYNDGTLMIHGAFRTRLLIQDDHMCHAKSLNYEVYVSSRCNNDVANSYTLSAYLPVRWSEQYDDLDEDEKNKTLAMSEDDLRKYLIDYLEFDEDDLFEFQEQDIIKGILNGEL